MGTEGADFLLPPDFSPNAKQPAETTAYLGKLDRDRQDGNSARCSIRDLWFSLERAETGKNWVAELPAPHEWFGNGFVRRSREEWNHFLDQIYDLESSGCITPEGYETATDRIRESMPAPAELASFFRDPLDDRGFIDLGPDTRLFIERSLFRTPGAETETNYAGELKVYYNVLVKRAGEIGLKLQKIQRSAGLKRKAQNGFPDTTLAHSFGKTGRFVSFCLHDIFRRN
jgi:hypothetical protein